MQIFAAIYFLATAIAILVLAVLLNINHLGPGSRGPEVLILASILLGVSQAYGLNWALYQKTETNSVTKNKNLKNLWVQHFMRTTLPIALGFFILIHFLWRQDNGFNDGHVPPMVNHGQMINQTSLLIIFLLVWLASTYVFQLLSEKDHVNALNAHFSHLNELNTDYRSDLTHSWGLWSAILFSLNQFSEILAQRTRLLKSFSRFVTKEVAKNALEIELKDVGGESRELTVMMSDIRNFTSMSEHLSPQQVVALLNEYFTVMISVMAEHNIVVDKFIGDGILAYVDTDKGNENNLAVQAALHMLEQLKPLNEKLLTKGLPEISIGLGINRGPLVIGLIGSENKLQHTIIGDTVNRAARLEGLCKELGVSIVIDALIWRSLNDDLKARFTSFGKKTLKGISEEVELYGGPVHAFLASPK